MCQQTLKPWEVVKPLPVEHSRVYLHSLVTSQPSKGIRVFLNYKLSSKITLLWVKRTYSFFSFQQEYLLKKMLANCKVCSLFLALSLKKVIYGQSMICMKYLGSCQIFIHLVLKNFTFYYKTYKYFTS